MSVIQNADVSAWLFGGNPNAGSDWGPWLLDPEAYVLWRGDRRYEVDLERCLDSAHVLDWIVQVNGKPWEDGSVAGLVAALSEVLHPQSTLCSFGQNRSLTQAQVRERVDRWVADNPAAERVVVVRPGDEP